MLSFDEEPKIHMHALKHLSEEDVLDAWYSAAESIKRSSNDDPARWLSIGFCAKGAVELISVENEDGFLIIHANKLTEKFRKEIDEVKRRMQ